MWGTLSTLNLTLSLTLNLSRQVFVIGGEVSPYFQTSKSGRVG